MSDKKEPDRVIWRHDIPGVMRVSTNTISRWINSGKFPAPDVQMSRSRFGWRLSTLRESGINLA